MSRLTQVLLLVLSAALVLVLLRFVVTEQPIATPPPPPPSPSPTPLPSVCEGIDYQPTGVSVSAPATGRFVDVTKQAGLDYLHWHMPETIGETRCAAVEYTGGGAAVADFNADGWLDLFVTRMELANKLFINQGDGTFVDQAAEAGLDYVGLSNGAGVADVDGDGDLDLYVTELGPSRNLLYINDGQGKFSEEAVQRAASVPIAPSEGCSRSFSPAFGDIDNDGDLDLMTSQWFLNPMNKGDEQFEGTGLTRTGMMRVLGGTSKRSRLLRNEGGGFFRDTTTESGVDLLKSASLTPSFADMDGDGWNELLMVADWGTSRLFLNKGKGLFTEITRQAAVGMDDSGMGSALGDIDNDGDLDWFVTSIYDPTCEQPCLNNHGNKLYINRADGRFDECAFETGTVNGYWAWGAALFDFDLDGDLDLAQANGWKDIPMGVQVEGVDYEHTPARLWRNDAVDPWPEVAEQYGFIDDRVGHALIPFDMDNDGDLDIFMGISGGRPALFRNDVAQGRSWLRIRLVGRAPNTHGIGARIELVVEPGAHPIRRDIFANSSYLGQEAPEAHYGLGDKNTPIAELRVHWPAGGGSSILKDVAPNQILTIRQD